MNFTEAKQYIIMQNPDFLPSAKRIGSKPSWVCPCCNNGSGKSGTGITMLPRSQDHPTYKCFKCGISYDNIDLAKIYWDVDTAEAFEKLYECFHIEVDSTKPGKEFTPLEYHVPDRKQEVPIVYEDQLEYFKECVKNLDPSYLESRGISEKTQRHYMIGTDKNWKNPLVVDRFKKEGYNLDWIKASPRCIIPTSRTSYLARDTRKEIPKEELDYSKQKYGAVRLFNLKFASLKDIIVVTEGEIDAASPYEATNGLLEGIGLGSVANWKRLAILTMSNLKEFNEETIEYLNTKIKNSFIEKKDKEKDKNCFYLEEINEVQSKEKVSLAGKSFILALDNDEAGRKTTEILKIVLQILGVNVVEAHYQGKDPNEALQKSKEQFASLLWRAVEELRSKEREPERDEPDM